jgi:WD40 repeat protein
MAHLFRILCVLILMIAPGPVRAVDLRQVVSREHPAIQGTGQGLAVGQDGCVYVSGVGEQGGYVLRISRDGLQKFGMTTNYAITGVAARADGILATSNAHFAKSVSLYSREGIELGKVPGFTGNDQVGWDGPGTLEVGASGDFYALDQHVNRIVRINSAAEIVRSYPMPDLKQLAPGRLWSYGFRVHETSEQFYFVTGSEIQCWSFAGTKRWSVPARVAGDPWGGFIGGLDVDEAGLLSINDGADAKIRQFDVAGKPVGEVILNRDAWTIDSQRRISHLRTFGEDIVVRQKSDTEIFQVYDRKTGKFRRAVSIEHEQLSVTYASSVWIAGTAVPLTIRFDAFGRKVQPQLNAWMRPLGTVNYQKLALDKNAVSVPSTASGLYQVRVTAGIDGEKSEYLLDTVIEIRPENAVGSLSLFTPLNRRSYGRGEVIPVTILCRTKNPAARPDAIEVKLLDRQGKDHFKQIVPLPQADAAPAVLQIPGTVTASLEPGEFRVTTEQTGWTIAGQVLSLGDRQPSENKTPFYRVRHGDYTTAVPSVTYYNAPEQIARHITATHKLGENLLVDRLGHSGSGILGEIPHVLRDTDLQDRLRNDPIAVAPEKAEFESRLLQTIAGYGSSSIEQRAILLFMDAGLPIGTGFDKRPLAEMARDIATVTRGLENYPAFRGWSWAANWWIEKRGAEMAASPAEQTEYQAALKAAQETGKWHPVLETVSDRWVGQAITAEQQFRKALDSAASRKLISAMTGPYRQPGILPPLTYANADEVDLHFQAEQIQWPMMSAHNVDFYKRPGKLAWGHPEIWNDDGTGGQILSTAMQMVMRGANGIGQSGSTKGFAQADADPRGMGAGASSIHRQLNHWLAAYGPWLSSSTARDPIAIPVSTRMMRMELGWQGVGGFYFTRLFEAYNACLRAHRPATFVFTEDCQPDSLSHFKAILMISQTVELDAPLSAALGIAAKAGVPIFMDQSCRADLLKEFSPRQLDREFTHLEKEAHLLNDDSACWRYREIILGHTKGLVNAWSSSIQPIAKCAHPEVLLTERQLGDALILWAVNDAAVPLEPGHMWRVSLAIGSRMPVLTTVEWPVSADRDVYELFSGKKVDGSQPLLVDLRHAPARVFVSLPKQAQPKATPPNVAQTGSISERIPTTGPRPANEPFGARIRDLVVSGDGQTTLVTVAGWDRNLMLVDSQSGKIQRQEKIGQHFAYAPVSTSQGFAAQGYDLNSAEGYHLYLLDSASGGGKSVAQRRFALYGLPKRGTNWAISRQYLEQINNFAISPDGNWIASAGDLGLVVWSRDGKKLWSQDWWSTGRQRRRLLAADAQTLVAYDGFTASAFKADTGEQKWTHSLGVTGILTGAAASRDGNVVVLRSTAKGGRIFVVNNGQLVNELTTPADDFALSPDGRFVAVAWHDELRFYDVSGGLVWTSIADDTVRSPRFSLDSSRLSLSTELGTLLVFNTAGNKLLECDLEALPVTAWLQDGGLLVGTWTGRLSRLNADFVSTWTTTLQSDAETSGLNLLAADPVATTRMEGWGNAALEPAPLTPNLLTQTQAIIDARCEPTTSGDPRVWQNKIDILRDGDPTIPDRPWLEWTDISYIDSGWRQKLFIQADTFRSQVRLKGITIVEDAKHPESWTRDTRLEWWDATAEKWQPGPYLLWDGRPNSGANQTESNGSSSRTLAHTHWFDKPLEAAKFRFVTTGGASWPVGNIRWGELVFHGEILGPSHPDAIANRPVAVLFDEREDVLKNLLAYGSYPFAFRYDDAASGGKCLALTSAGSTTANWRPPFGHVLPNWDFEIVEHPEKPGQYRWLEFAWKSSGPKTTGVTLRVGPHHGGGVAINAGTATAFEGVVAVQQAAGPPTKWETVRVDLWKLHGTPFQVRSMSLGATGDGALFDRLRLARTEKDLND